MKAILYSGSLTLLFGVVTILNLVRVFPSSESAVSAADFASRFGYLHVLLSVLSVVSFVVFIVSVIVFFYRKIFHTQSRELMERTEKV